MCHIFKASMCVVNLVYKGYLCKIVNNNNNNKIFKLIISMFLIVFYYHEITQ